MKEFSEICALYFYKHFPQLQGHLSLDQQHDIERFIQEISACSNIRDAWLIVESNLFMMIFFQHHIAYIMEPSPSKAQQERALFLFSICLILGLSSMVGFKRYIPTECIATISMILGAFCIVLKNRCQRYFQSLKNPLTTVA